MAKAAWLGAHPVRTALVTTLLLLSMAPSAPAYAQGSVDDGAVEYYRRGREHFEAGRYREAIGDLEQALSLDPSSATLVYNVARVHELLGQLDEALGYYRRYLGMLAVSEANERERVQATIDRLEGARSQVDTTPQVTNQIPEGERQMDRPVVVYERGVADAAFWITTGTAAALFVASAVTGALALTAKSNVDGCVLGAGCNIEDRDQYANQTSSLALATDVLLIGGAAAALTALLLYALRTQRVETYPEYEPTAFIGSDGTGAVLGVRGGF